MQYRVVPKTGEKLSALGYGCMRLPVKDGQIDEARANRQLYSAIDRGVNYIDTAWLYHGTQSEVWLGKALAAGRRERVNIATKLPTPLVGSRADMDKYLDAQLKKLQTDRIDYYLLHTLDAPLWKRLKELDVFDFMGKALADGRVRHFGFSFHGTREDFVDIVDAYDWTLCQIQYSFLDEQNQAGTAGLEYAASKKVAVAVMEPLRGGRLGNPAPPEPIAALWARAATKRAPVDWALRWVWNRPEVTTVLSGMNEETHIEENLAIAETALPGALSDEELVLIGQVVQKYRDLLKVPCTGCGYCLPCPAGVNIPVCFEIYGNLHLYGKKPDAMFTYAMRADGGFAGESGVASRCVRCGECVETCPQGLAVPELLADVAAELEGEGFEKYRQIVRKLTENRI